MEKNAIGVSDELEKLINAEAAPSRIERQLKKLNGYESDCVHSLQEALANVKEEKLTDDLLKEWDEFIHKYCVFPELPRILSRKTASTLRWVR